MGCDIHMHYEIKQDDGKWSRYDWEVQFRIGEYSDGSPKYDYDKIFDFPLYVSRNYNLFAILANVRNGRGFAGCKTSEGFEPISEPRGLPEDAAPETKADSEFWGIDGHSRSWLALREVMEYDWGKTVTCYGIVSPEEYGVFLKNGKPDGWCGGVGGRDVRNISESDMKMIVDGTLAKEDGIHYYTKVSWQETYRSAVGEHWFSAMKWLDENFGADNVRLVFWFDN